jgi:undecaprenyl-phosphate galactose phosphotransferase
MRKDADIRLKALLEQNPALRKEWEETRKLKNDPRTTSVGRFLRKTSLDELPQFWNVLIGDLSVVGPRPVVQAEITKYYGLKGSKILSVRPGLTCLWQVSGRNDTSYENRVRLDEEYIENQSMSMDVKLILKTIPAMIFTKGAY